MEEGLSPFTFKLQHTEASHSVSIHSHIKWGWKKITTFFFLSIFRTGTWVLLAILNFSMKSLGPASPSLLWFQSGCWYTFYPLQIWLYHKQKRNKYCQHPDESDERTNASETNPTPKWPYMTFCVSKITCDQCTQISRSNTVDFSVNSKGHWSKNKKKTGSAGASWQKVNLCGKSINSSYQHWTFWSVKTFDWKYLY